MDLNLTTEILLIILVIVAYFVTGNYYRKKAGNSTGWLKWIVIHRSISLITSGILLIGVFLYYLFIRLK